MKIVIEIDGDFMGGHLVYNKWEGSHFTISSMPVPVPEPPKGD